MWLGRLRPVCCGLAASTSRGRLLGGPWPGIPCVPLVQDVRIRKNNQGARSVTTEGGGGAGSTLGSLDGLTAERVREFVASLTPEQQQIVLTEIQQVQATLVKQKAEEKLASWRWRSRFGRPTSLVSQTMGADPTGTYCEIPQEWLKKKVAEKNKPKPPTASELRQLAVHNAVPFIGFGLLDNFIMIVAGDYIDANIGTALGISTMAAAALGNTVSDLAGIGSAWYVENVAVKIGILPPELSQEQLDFWSARWVVNLGRGVGVVLGCLIGMFPLLFLPMHEDEKKTPREE